MKFLMALTALMCLPTTMGFSVATLTLKPSIFRSFGVATRASSKVKIVLLIYSLFTKY